MPLVPQASQGRRGVFSHVHPLHQTLGQLHVVVTQVTDLRLDAERGKQPPAANPQEHFFLSRNSGPPP